MFMHLQVSLFSPIYLQQHDEKRKKCRTLHTENLFSFLKTLILIYKHYA